MINAIVYYTGINDNCTDGIKVTNNIKQVQVFPSSHTENKGRISFFYSINYSHDFEFYYPDNSTKDLRLQIDKKIVQQIYTCLKNRSDDGYAHIDLDQIIKKAIKDVEDEI